MSATNILISFSRKMQKTSQILWSFITCALINARSADYFEKSNLFYFRYFWSNVLGVVAVED